MVCHDHGATAGRRWGAIPPRSEEITMNTPENERPPAAAGRGRRPLRRGVVAVIVGVLVGGTLAMLEPAVAQGPPGGPGSGLRGGPGGGPGGPPFPPHGRGGRAGRPSPGPSGGWRHAPPPYHGGHRSHHRYDGGWVWPWFWLSLPFYYGPWSSPYPYYRYEPYPYYWYEPEPSPPPDDGYEPEPWPSLDGWNSR